MIVFRRILAVALVLMAFLLLAPTTSYGQEAPEDTSLSVDEHINNIMAPVTKWLSKLIFAGIALEDGDGNPLIGKTGAVMELPLILLWLVGAAMILTVYFRFLNVRGLALAFRTVKGKYSKPDDPGEITHFQALTAALSATVGLGNIAGVAIAVGLGGPGAVFWMIVAGILGMTSKFAECTLGVKYRIIRNGKVFGGPMYYLRDGLKERDMGGLGKVLALIFAICCVGAAFGGGNMFQANQSCQQLINVTATDEHEAARKELARIDGAIIRLTGLENQMEELSEKSRELTEAASASEYDWRSAELAEDLATVEAELEAERAAIGGDGEALANLQAERVEAALTMEETQGFLARNKWIFGAVMAVFVGLVIIGGIVGIAKVTARLVPIMTIIYIVGCLIVLFANFSQIPWAFSHIVSEAFSPEATVGGFIGAFIQGIRRAAFSNEAGFGSAPIAHAAVKTSKPASEGVVALLEPFVDTVIVCTMTGLAIVVTQLYVTAPSDGIQLTSDAFATVIPWFPYVLLLCVVLFAFSTMISWSYYGQQAWIYIFGPGKKRETVYKLLFCGFVVVGASLSLGQVVDFSDGMLFSMSIFNLLGVYMLLPVVKREYHDFIKHAKSVDDEQRG